MTSRQHLKKYVNLKKESGKKKWNELVLFPCKTNNCNPIFPKSIFPFLGKFLDPLSCLFVKDLETSYLISLNMKGRKGREVHIVTHFHVG